MKKGKLIVFEGLDYSFKETNTKKLLEYINTNGKGKAELYSFPNYESDSAKYVKEYLSGEFGEAKDLNPYATSVLYLMDRLVTVKREKIKELLNEGCHVILDRYVFSNIFFQSTKLDSLKERREFREWIYDLEFNKVGLPKPDITIFMNMPLSVSYTLMQERSNKTGEDKDVHENNRKFMEEVEKVATEVISEYNVQTIECSESGRIRTEEEIFNDILTILEFNEII